jgi:hypothetical protein
VAVMERGALVNVDSRSRVCYMNFGVPGR